MPSLPRPISPVEVAVIVAALERAPTARPVRHLRIPVDALQVVVTCPCGCDSVGFLEAQPPSRLVANAIGTRPFGGLVGVLVWGTDEDITGLEVYDLTFDDQGIVLPIPESVQVDAS